ncbi:hypothetical protein CK203_107941 [Vitis vinifera]|uniref:Uncharacterized protein n=1 Tax=Vitis vinifera TaxID=29760 RepID=A0A438C5Q6_VITVI|nr:hypothetical protein CK203_107941 [Vitis vinifera]
MEVSTFIKEVSLLRLLLGPSLAYIRKYVDIDFLIGLYPLSNSVVDHTPLVQSLAYNHCNKLKNKQATTQQTFNLLLKNSAPQSHAQSSLQSELGVGEEVENVGAGASGSQSVILLSILRYKQTAKRILKCTAICKSPFVMQCLKQFLKIPHQDRVIANYALIEDVDPSEVLCDMHGMYITKEELSCLNGDWWVNSVEFAITLNADRLGRDLGTCDMGNLKTIIGRGQMHVYRLQLVVTLLLNEGNNVRDKILQGVSIVTEAIPREVCHFVEIKQGNNPVKLYLPNKSGTNQIYRTRKT